MKPITLQFNVDDFKPGGLEFCLKMVLRDWVGCMITFRYTYWKEDKWSYNSPIDTRIVDHIVDRSYNVEEFKIWIRDGLFITNPN